MKAIFADINDLDAPWQETLKQIDLDEPHEWMQKDYEICIQFLSFYTNREPTFRSYRRDLERLCQWSWKINKKSIIELGSADIHEFEKFYTSPGSIKNTKPSDWIAVNQNDRFINVNGIKERNDNWRPFVATISKQELKERKKGINIEDNKSDKSLITIDDYELKPSSKKAISASLSSFYNYLLEEEITQKNPLKKKRGNRTKTTSNARGVKRINESEWDAVIDVCADIAKEDEQYERALFILQMMYQMYLRISELIPNETGDVKMNNFYCTEEKGDDGKYRELWWFEAMGKGNKIRIIPVNEQMIGALKRYRTYLGLNELPTQSETTPLLHKHKIKNGRITGITSERTIRGIVQECFDKAIERLEEQGVDVRTLKTASPHSIRHTGISDDIAERPIHHVQEDAGHSSIKTTDNYVSSEKIERHKSKTK
ncbi:hypothetical protein A3715_17585 [Oleiphilus sp. HI0009]|nr:hypothetical protein A3715_17585 [Oleiphilus sp. HI0009]